MPGPGKSPLRVLGPPAVWPQQHHFPLGLSGLSGLREEQVSCLRPSGSCVAAQHLLGGRDKVGIAVGVVGASARVGGQQRQLVLALATAAAAGGMEERGPVLALPLLHGVRQGPVAALGEEHDAEH